MNLYLKYGFFAFAFLFGALFFSGIVFVESGRLPGSLAEADDIFLISFIFLTVAGLYIYVVWKQSREENDNDFLYKNSKFKK